MKQVIKHRDGGLLGRSGDGSRRSGDGSEVNPESWTQLKGSNEKRI